MICTEKPGVTEKIDKILCQFNKFEMFANIRRKNFKFAEEYRHKLFSLKKLLSKSVDITEFQNDD